MLIMLRSFSGAQVFGFFTAKFFNMKEKKTKKQKVGHVALAFFHFAKGGCNTALFKRKKKRKGRQMPGCRKITAFYAPL